MSASSRATFAWCTSADPAASSPEAGCTWVMARGIPLLPFMSFTRHARCFQSLGIVDVGSLLSVDVVGVLHFRDGWQQERWNHASDMAALDRLLGGPM
jgi:hypothetical protein